MSPVPLQNLDRDGMTDQELVDLASQRDEAAIRTITKRHNRRIYRVARAILRNDVEAEDVVQETYVWQNYDIFPEFPELQRFLDFWQAKLEGPLHSVQVAHSKLIKPTELLAVDGIFRLH